MPNFGNIGRELAKEINEEPEEEPETEDESMSTCEIWLNPQSTDP